MDSTVSRCFVSPDFSRTRRKHFNETRFRRDESVGRYCEVATSTGEEDSCFSALSPLPCHALARLLHSLAGPSGEVADRVVTYAISRAAQHLQQELEWSDSRGRFSLDLANDHDTRMLWTYVLCNTKLPFELRSFPK